MDDQGKSTAHGRDRHVLEALGKTRVVIEDGKVVEIGEPLVEFCPLFSKQRGIDAITQGAVKQNIEFRLSDFGMCLPSRKLKMKDFLTFGISEILGMLVSRKVLDCAVIVCDGAGTVVVPDAELIQGIGGRVSGIIETSPIPRVIETIGEKYVLDPRTAEIDQVKGTDKAFDLGFRKVAVTVAMPGEAQRIRGKYGSRVVIFGVHTTGLTEAEAETLFDNSDIVTACASLWVREKAKHKAVFKVGNKVPIYAGSPFGEEILRMRMRDLDYEALPRTDDPPRPLI